MTTVENMQPVPLRSAGGVKAVSAAEDAMVESAIKREESQIVDEDVTSEDEAPVEEQMLQVAIAQSVAETRKPVKATRHSPNSPRFGLRKKRRFSETQSSSDSDKVNGPVQSQSELSGSSSERIRVSQDACCSETSPLPATVTPRQPQANKQEVKEEPPIPAPHVPATIDRGGPAQIHRVAVAVKEKDLPGPPTVTVPQVKPPPPMPITPAARLPVSTTATKSIAPKHATILPPAVPTRLPPANLKPAPRPQLFSQSAPIQPKKIAPATIPPRGPSLSLVPPHLLRAGIPGQTIPMKPNLSTSAVPNPLSMPISPASLLLPAPSRQRQQQKNPARKPLVETSVPCPLSNPVPCPLPPTTFVSEEPAVARAPPVAIAEKKVIISEPIRPPSPVESRPRVFSVDLDPSTFDYPDVSTSADLSTADRSDSFVEEMTSSTPELAIFQRERAFSFEFFNFTGDELLPVTPNLPTSSSTELPVPDSQMSSNRPRGDSIIFDPVSFQDGGIHEKNALMKPRTPSLGSNGDGLLGEPNFSTANTGISNSSLPQPVLSSSSTAAPAALVKISAATAGVTSFNSTSKASSGNVAGGQMATLPSSLNACATTGTSPATFQMDLLNKDGRIGIYLPAARRARIARFHAKRKMRIWRKRIKYDCRKKLADSRPRIKGRFVKRSDMEDDP